MVSRSGFTVTAGITELLITMERGFDTAVEGLAQASLDVSRQVTTSLPVKVLSE
jgi:hypothetical protein